MATDYPILYEGNLPYIFISYSHKSYEQVYRILHSLNRHGVRFWYDQGLQKGIDWEQHVKDKILAASEVWFFFDKQFFYSPSLITEVSIVDKEHKPYCPIYYEGQMFMQLYRDLPWDVALRTEDERLLNKCFHPKITAVVKGNDSDVFLRELVQEAQKVSAVTAPGSQTVVKSRYAFVSIQDERATAYYEGIAEVLNGSDCKLEQRLVQDDGQDIALSSTLLALAESKPDGVVVRCTAKPGEVVLDSLRRLCQATKVVLLEHDLDEREQIRLGPSCPQFVAADLDKGGACLAGAAMQIALGYGWQDTDVVVCCPPKEAPGYRMGCAVWDAMSGADIRPVYVGGGSNASSTFAAMQGACQTMPSEIGGRSLVLYTGDAELTRYVVEHLDNLQMGRTPASRYAHIILLGYDRKIQDVIKNTPYGYVLLDTMPVLQGAEAARRLLGKAPTSRVGLVAPALQKHKVAPSFCTNKVSTLFPLIDACDIVVDGEGVLTDTTPIWWQIFDDLLGKYGIKIEEQDKKHYPVDAGALVTKVQHKTGIAIDKATFVQESTKQYAEAWLKYKPTAYP